MITPFDLVEVAWDLLASFQLHHLVHFLGVQDGDIDRAREDLAPRERGHDRNAAELFMLSELLQGFHHCFITVAVLGHVDRFNGVTHDRHGVARA